MCVTIMWSVSFSQNRHRIVWGLVIFEMITTQRPLYLHPKSAEAILFNLYVCYRVCDMMCFFVFLSFRCHNIHKALLGRFVYARDGADVFFLFYPIQFGVFFRALNLFNGILTHCRLCWLGSFALPRSVELSEKSFFGSMENVVFVANSPPESR